MRSSTLMSAVGLIALLLTGCVTLPSADSRADDLLNSMLTTTVKIYSAIEGAGLATCSHDANAADWKMLDMQARLLKLRFTVLPNSDNELSAATVLEATIASAEASDKLALAKPAKCQNTTAAALDETAIESAITGLQRIELQKGKK